VAGLARGLHQVGPRHPRPAPRARAGRSCARDRKTAETRVRAQLAELRPEWFLAPSNLGCPPPPRRPTPPPRTPPPTRARPAAGRRCSRAPTTSLRQPPRSGARPATRPPRAPGRAFAGRVPRLTLPRGSYLAWDRAKLLAGRGRRVEAARCYLRASRAIALCEHNAEVRRRLRCSCSCSCSSCVCCCCRRRWRCAERAGRAGAQVQEDAVALRQELLLLLAEGGAGGADGGAHAAGLPATLVAGLKNDVAAHLRMQACVRRTPPTLLPTTHPTVLSAERDAPTPARASVRGPPARAALTRARADAAAGQLWGGAPPVRGGARDARRGPRGARQRGRRAGGRPGPAPRARAALQKGRGVSD